jgi:hypothetical protein
MNLRGIREHAQFGPDAQGPRDGCYHKGNSNPRQETITETDTINNNVSDIDGLNISGNSGAVEITRITTITDSGAIEAIQEVASDGLDLAADGFDLASEGFDLAESTIESGADFTLDLIGALTARDEVLLGDFTESIGDANTAISDFAAKVATPQSAAIGDLKNIVIVGILGVAAVFIFGRS